MSDIEIESTGAVIYKNRIVGELDGDTLVLNAGWLRLAGLGLRVDGDTRDRRRVLLDRPASNGKAAPEKVNEPPKSEQQEFAPDAPKP